MRIALDELAKDLMLEGPVPRAVATALMNCLRAIEDHESIATGVGEKVGIELAVANSAPSETLVGLDLEIAKLSRFGGLLAYLAGNSGGKDVQPVFFALMDSVETICSSLSVAADRLMPTAMTTRR
jgi:hypothetical protein